MLDRLALWIGLILAALAALAFVFGLPWLSGILVVAAVVTLILAVVGGSRDVRRWWRGRRSGEAALKAGFHGIVGVGRDWVRCTCGWTGTSQDHTRHVAGVEIPSTGVGTELPSARAVETQRLLSEVAHAGQKLLGRLNAYPAREGDLDAEKFWKDQMQVWTDWADRLNHWRLPHLRANFANDAGRDSAAYVGTSWQHHLQTWMDVRMVRLNEFILRAKELQDELGPEPSEDELKEPEWAEAPDPLVVRLAKAMQATPVEQLDPNEIVRSLAAFIPKIESFRVYSKARPLETPEEAWQELDNRMDEQIAEVSAFLRDYRPRHWQRLRDALKRPIPNTQEPIGVHMTESDPVRWFTAGRGDHSLERLRRTEEVVRQAIEEGP